jgi:DNA replication protein DnaC
MAPVSAEGERSKGYAGAGRGRAKTASTIFCSQFDVPGWHENLYDPTLADAICDRIVYDSYIIRIEGDTMRKRKGIMD